MKNVEYAFHVGQRIDDHSVRVLSSGVMSTLGGAVACLAKDYAYYAIVCGYEMYGEIEPMCAECQGRGEVKRKRSGRLHSFKRCPSCNGKPGPEPIEVPFGELTERTLCELRDQCQEKQ